MKSKYLSEYVGKTDGLSICAPDGEMAGLEFAECCVLESTEQVKRTQFRADTLYFAREEVLRGAVLPEGLSFTVLKFSERGPGEGFKRAAKLVIMAENAEVYDAFLTRCHDVLSIDAEMAHGMLHLTRMVALNKSLTDIVNYIGEMYHTMVSIVDNAFSIMAYADRQCAGSAILINEYSRGWLDTSAVKTLNQIDFLTPTVKRPEYKYYDIVQTSGGNGIGGYVRNNYCVIYINFNAAAAISVFDNYDIDEYKLKYMEEISYALSSYMQKQEFYQLNRGAYFNHLMSIIISDLDFDEAVMQNRLAMNGYMLEQYKYIITVEKNAAVDDLGQMDSLALYLKNLFPNSIYIVLKSKLMYLMSLKKPMEAEEFLALDKFMKSVDVRVGVSNAFKILGDVQIFIDEANEALNIGRQTDRGANIYLYEDYHEMSVARVLVQSGGHPEKYLYPPLMELIHYDSANGGALVETLYEYIKNSKNPKQVYEKLFIHKNTLYYRLDKIKQIMGVNFEAADVQMKINLTFAILEYLRKERGESAISLL